MIGTVIGLRPEKLVEDIAVRAVDLDPVETDCFGIGCPLAEGIDDRIDFVLRCWFSLRDEFGADAAHDTRGSNLTRVLMVFRLRLVEPLQEGLTNLSDVAKDGDGLLMNMPNHVFQPTSASSP